MRNYLECYLHRQLAMSSRKVGLAAWQKYLLSHLGGSRFDNKYRHLVKAIGRIACQNEVA